MSVARLRRERFEDRRPRWFDIPEEADPDHEASDYDRFGMMMKVDGYERPWRDLINEYGFTHVLNCMRHTSDANRAADMLARARVARQGR